MAVQFIPVYRIWPIGAWALSQRQAGAKKILAASVLF